MSKTIKDLEIATSLEGEDEFLFYQNSSKKTKKVSRKNMFSSVGIVMQGKVIDPDYGDLGVATATATANAALALSTANGAQTSANGKNEIYYQTSAPTITNFIGSISGTTLTVTSASAGSVIVGKPITDASKAISDGTIITAFVSGTSGAAGIYTVSVSQSISSTTIYCGYNNGDVWYDTDDSYKIYVYNGGSWTASFAPFPGIDTNGNVTGLVRVTGTESTFALLATKFQIIDPANPTTKTDANVPFEIVGGSVFIKNAQIQTVDAGKLTAGFIGAQTIEVNSSTGYIQSSTFIPTWASGLVCKVYNAGATYFGKTVPSDVVRVKVLQTDGSYKVYNCTSAHTSSGGSFPGTSGGLWSEVTPIPTTTVDVGDGSVSIDNFGFRIVGNGQAEFSGAIFRGAVIAKEGFFGTTKNAAKIDSNGLTIGNYGRIKSAGIGYNGTDFTSTSGSGGFFIGNTQAEGYSALYQFFIGDPSGNYMRWNGSTLAVNGNIIGGSTVGSSGGSVGLVMNTQYGIRRSSDDALLTITGGYGNGIYYGAQIDLVGSVWDTSGSDIGSGELVLSAGYRSGANYNGPLDGSIIFRTSRENNSTDNDNDGHSGAQRFRIEADGTVRVIYTPTGTADGEVISGYPNTNPGRFLVEGSANGKHVQIKDGKIEFLSGNTSSASDTNLYRYTADALGTDDDLYIGGNTTRYLYFPNGGHIVWSSDTNLYRSGANTLKTDDDFIAASVTTTSARRTKKNIKKYNAGLDVIEKLKPVSFDRKMDGKSDIGFIAEDVDKVLPTIVAKNNKGQAEGLDYSKITVVLVNAIKELKKEIDLLKGK